MYALIVESKEVLGTRGIFTEEGTEFLVTIEEEGWVPGTSTEYHMGDTIRKDTKIFKSVQHAQHFAKSWGGHPWWCKPNGKYRVIKLEAVYEEPEVKYYEEVKE